MAADQNIYDATYQAARDAMGLADLSGAAQSAVNNWLNRNREDIIYVISETCGVEMKSFLELNREEIIESIAAQAKGGDE